MSGPESHMNLGDQLNISIERYSDFKIEEKASTETAFDNADSQFRSVIGARGKLFLATTEWVENQNPDLKQTP